MRTKNRQVSRWLTVGVSCLALCLSINGMAQAALITFNFEGTMFNTIPSQLNPPILSNTPFSGFYTFESTAPDQFPNNPSYGRYALSDYSITLLGRTYSMITPGMGVIDVGGGNSYFVTPFPRSLSGPDPINGLTLQSSQFSGSGIFSSDALPLMPPSLSGPSGSRPGISMSFFPATGNPIGTGGTLTSLTLAPVPLPGALLLFGSGLLGLMGIGVGRRMAARTSGARINSSAIRMSESVERITGRCQSYR